MRNAQLNAKCKVQNAKLRRAWVESVSFARLFYVGVNQDKRESLIFFIFMMYVAFTRLPLKLLGLGPFRQPDGCHLPFQGRQEIILRTIAHKSGGQSLPFTARVSRDCVVVLRRSHCFLGSLERGAGIRQDD